MTATGTVLGFFTEHQDAEEALRQLQRQGFKRVALVRKESNQLRVEHKKQTRRGGSVTGGFSGLGLSSLGAVLWLTYRDRPTTPTGEILSRLLPAMAGATTVGAAAGWFAASRGEDVDAEVLERFGKWTVGDETLVIAQTAPARMGAALGILQKRATRPSTFAARPPHLDLNETGGDPLRGETYTVERLREHAVTVAQTHRTRLGEGHGRQLLSRLRDNEKIIGQVSADLAEAVRLDQPVSLSSEWLIDNAYIIQSQILDVQSYLSGRFYEELPVLTKGKMESLPRVYAMAVELIQHADGRLDETNVREFVSAYQEHAPLSIGELWALPLMLRLALIENLRRLVVGIDQRQRDRERADFWANRLLTSARRAPGQVLELLADLTREGATIGAHFADRLVSHLYDEQAALVPIQNWLELTLDAPLAEIIQRDQRRQAADQISVSNAITSLRFLGALDWREMYEELSLVEKVLRDDPAGVYSSMDFATRNRYRNNVEALAKGSACTEIEIARRAIEAARAPAETDHNGLAERRHHVGFYLLDKGRRQVEAQINYEPELREWLLQIVHERPTPLYLGGIALGTVGVLGGLNWAARRCGAALPWPLRLLALVPASEVAMQVMNNFVTRLLQPEGLPRMSFEDGIPDDWRTLVVVPMMLTSPEGIQQEVDRLEVHYLSNPDPNLRFALLSDWMDAPAATASEDADLLDVAVRGINELNARYGATAPNPAGEENSRSGEVRFGPPFYLFHRDRHWSESEGAWMGWERKRGKLEQLNKYLLGERSDDGTVLHPVAGDAGRLEGMTFVITLDADTQMPHGAAGKMIETLAHPLNRPVVTRLDGGADGAALVTSGYTLIQPRVSPTLPSAMTTRFSRLFSEPAGIDPYTRVVSDVYQDLFNEGSYHGKGIYDLRAFHEVLSDRFPESTLLSHDLIEGAHVRVGLATDIELFDQFPPDYLSFIKRQHRWIRGDWQILDWLTNAVPVKMDGPHGAKDSDGRMPDGRALNVLSPLNRWKIGDNLRRSLLQPATLGLLVGGWLAGPIVGQVASAFGAGVLLFGSLLQAANWLTTNPLGVFAAWRDLRDGLVRELIAVALLPHSSYMALDAIVRVLFRRLVSKQLLLEWQTAQATYSKSGSADLAFLAQLSSFSLGALTLGGVLLLRSPVVAVVAAPYIALWAMGPLFMRWLGGGRRKPVAAGITNADRKMLRGVARQTWRYFDDFIGPQTNWLPPDNYQEALNIEIAQRTSPTNIGLWLNALLAAHDFGYISTDEVVGRALETVETLEELEKYRGHLLNWYNVQTLDPLPPRYVSTVDSGNLLGSLWVMARGVRELVEQPVLRPHSLTGLGDSLELLEASLCNTVPAVSSRHIQTLHRLLDEPPENLLELVERLCAALEPVELLAVDLVGEAANQLPGPRGTLDLQDATTDPRFSIRACAYWAAQVEQQLRIWSQTLNRYLEWVQPLAAPHDDFLKSLGEEALALRREALDKIPTIAELSRGDVPALTELLDLHDKPGAAPDAVAWLKRIAEAFGRARWLAGEEMADAEQLIDRMRHLADEMDLRFLYDEERKLFAIGFSVEEARRDSSHYDLLVSECRLTSFLAIARGEIPVEHWWALTRRFGSSNGQAVLLSWSGTMFEYLMPPLFLHSFENSLLDRACTSAIWQQIAYGKKRGIPWGISEAAFADIDARGVYQYKAFGVPWLGLQRGHENDRVVAPYATMMALPFLPAPAMANLRRLEELGARGDYGFYESIDFARQKLGDDEGFKPTTDEKGAIVRTFMVHHQGMALLAMDNLLHGNVMRERFHADPYVRATTPLLFERYPSAPAVVKKAAVEGTTDEMPLEPARPEERLERFNTPDTPLPSVHLLANASGEYAVMVTAAGGGYSRWKDLDVTRWRADTTRDNRGSFVYLRDLDSRSAWSVSHQPLRRAARQSSVTFKAERAEFRRRDAEIETFTEIIVPPDDNAEIRRVNLVNHSTRKRRIEVTSYAEIALATHNADRAHPAFSKLFIQTETQAIGDDASTALLAWRRPRSSEDETVWAGHLLTVTASGQASDDTVDALSTYETDRARFLGRGHTAADPIALEGDLSNTVGAVLDPVFSLRRVVELEPGQRASATFITAAAETRAEIVAILEKYHDEAAVGQAFDLAWTSAQLELSHLRIQPEDARTYQRLASHMVYPFHALRAPASRLRANQKGQESLWAYGISGDLPILVVTINSARDVSVVRQALLAHTFWRRRGFKADLVILNQRGDGYFQELNEDLRRMIQAHSQYTGMDQPGGVFLRSSDEIPEADVTLLLAAARVVLVAARGSISGQLSGPFGTLTPQPPRLILSHRPPEEPSNPLPYLDLPYFNGLGGFTADGSEYAIYLGSHLHTPAPWSNIIANPRFGAMLTESGQGNVWFGNSQANRLTPWSNDPVSDPASEAVYIRDEETGSYWTPTPLPIRELDAYRTRHGQGYTVWEHNSHAIEQELVTWVPIDGASTETVGDADSPPIRLQRLRLRNASSRRRRLIVTAYYEWVLGIEREEAPMHVSTTWDAESSTLLARNAWNPNYGAKVAFASANPTPSHFTADRTDFLGRNGSPAQPYALRRQHVSDRVGAGLDPCAVLQVPVELEPGESVEITFLLGEADDVDEVRELVARFRDEKRIDDSFRGTRRWWDEFLSTLQVETPVQSVNFLLNRWLLYQNLSCRVWGRSAFYQSGGAWGFRDQLQDVMSLVYAMPQIAREQILRAARHQFEEGDVQHWWHEPAGAGVRTRISDDLLWLPLVVAHYIRVTGDASVLDEVEPFLHAPELEPDEHEKYFVPEVSTEAATIFVHCRRAIERGSTYGPHDLPLIGAGDWNDGLNRVGVEGKGESVWLAWFLNEVLQRFAEICEARAEAALADVYRKRAKKYVRTVERHAWDGEWYRRAYYDDGTPLGSHESIEARIDSLPQSWGVISGGAREDRVQKAMESVEKHLVKPAEGTIRLFTPAFDITPKDPGYIKGYVPGVRENGGQYTHAAIWVTMAFARRGDGDRAVELLRMLNPAEHARDEAAANLYKVEPYVVVADIYSTPGQVGRGGWTWYTGSASWMYRVWIEEVLGFHKRGDQLFIEPVIPRDWPEYRMRYRVGAAHYQIVVENPQGRNTGVAEVILDGEVLPDRAIPLQDDGREHEVRVRMGDTPNEKPIEKSTAKKA